MFPYSDKKLMRIYLLLIFSGLIALPINSMMSVTGNCSYKFDSPRNYLYRYNICRLENDTIIIENKYSNTIKSYLNLTETGNTFGRQTKFVHFKKSEQFVEKLKTSTEVYEKTEKNYMGCDIKPNPRCVHRPIHTNY